MLLSFTWIHSKTSAFTQKVGTGWGQNPGRLGKEGKIMALKWNQTNFPGVRYRNYPTRKHGVKPDQYFSIRIQVEGKRKEEGLGWASQGWSAKKADGELSKLREAARTGEGHVSLAEKREAAAAERKVKALSDEKASQDALSFSEFFHTEYLPAAEGSKHKESIRREKSLFKVWISSTIGNIPLKAISPMDIERLKKRMQDAGKAPRSIEYCLAVVRQVFSRARLIGFYEEASPTSKVKKPRFDNRRMRFLNQQEVKALLEALYTHSPDLHDQALLGLYAGLRAGEIFRLTWGDVDMNRKIMTLRDTKSGKTRTAYMTKSISEMLEKKGQGFPGDFVFSSRIGTQIERPSVTFGRVVKEIGLNDGRDDRRYKITFHSLRHTYASMLVENGTDIFTVKNLLGHSCITQTERYAHLSPETLRNAVDGLENAG